MSDLSVLCPYLKTLSVRLPLSSIYVYNLLQFKTRLWIFPLLYSVSDSSPRRNLTHQSLLERLSTLNELLDLLMFPPILRSVSFVYHVSGTPPRLIETRFFLLLGRPRISLFSSLYTLLQFFPVVPDLHSKTFGTFLQTSSVFTLVVFLESKKIWIIIIIY